MTTRNRMIRYVSDCCPGHIHDFALLKQQFPSTIEWFKTFKIHVDLGYLGFATQYPSCQVMMPHKKSKTHPLTEEEKRDNRRRSAQRVVVEHS